MATSETKAATPEINDLIRARYGGIASKAGASHCCAPSSCCGTTTAPVADEKSRRMGYSDAELAAVPEGANLGLGCGNDPGQARQTACTVSRAGPSASSALSAHGNLIIREHPARIK